VTEIDPVVPELRFRTLDSFVESYDIVSVITAAFAPIEKSTVTVVPILILTLHAIDESERQSLASHGVVPTWAFWLRTDAPNPFPINVMENMPVTGRLVTANEDITGLS
jgi:hypothetical protein